MKTLTKEQVQNLPPEQQIAFGNMELQRVRARRDLVDRIRGGRRADIVIGLLIGIINGLAIYSIVEPKALLFAVIAITGLMGFHFTRINRRWDALLELLNRDPGPAQGLNQDASTE